MKSRISSRLHSSRFSWSYRPAFSTTLSSAARQEPNCQSSSANTGKVSRMSSNRAHSSKWSSSTPGMRRTMCLSSTRRSARHQASWWTCHSRHTTASCHSQATRTRLVSLTDSARKPKSSSSLSRRRSWSNSSWAVSMSTASRSISLLTFLAMHRSFQRSLRLTLRVALKYSSRSHMMTKGPYSSSKDQRTTETTASGLTSPERSTR